MKDAKLNYARAVFEQLGPIYRTRKRELNRAEKALYEWALRVGIKALMPIADAREVIEGFNHDIEAQRARAEAATAKRVRSPADEPSEWEREALHGFTIGKGNNSGTAEADRGRDEDGGGVVGGGSGDRASRS